MNSNKPGNRKKINRRNFFLYLSAGAAGVYALSSLPFKIFQRKIKAESSIKVKENPFAVKRDAGGKGRHNG